MIPETYTDTDLTTNQREALALISGEKGASAQEIADELGYRTTSGAYDIVARLRAKGVPVVNRDGRYLLSDEPDDSVEPIEAIPDGASAVMPMQANRRSPKTKQSITRAANDFLRELEAGFRARLATVEPIRGYRVAEPGHQDLVMFRTDDHFGQTEFSLTADNEVVFTYNSEIARERVLQHYRHTLAVKEEREAGGVVFDTLYILVDGDIVTNESIYEEQPFAIDLTLRGQVKMASEAYLEIITDAAARFPSVVVVCQNGNHGELRARGSSSEANADDLLYDALELALDLAGYENVTFVKNNYTPESVFWFRRGDGEPYGRWMGYMRHGQDGMGHIGTRSAQQRWQSWLLHTAEIDPRPTGRGFDVGFTGHFHELKWEPVAGRPVLMGGSLKPGGEYENRLGIAPGRPGAFTFGVSDDEPIAWLDPVYFD
jgi:hypothetical protein